jgi:hypothetical protein
VALKNGVLVEGRVRPDAPEELSAGETGVDLVDGVGEVAGEGPVEVEGLKPN